MPPPRGKTKRPTNTKLGKKDSRDTSTPWTNFKVKGSKVKVTAANCVVGEKSTTTKARSLRSVVKSKWFTRWQHLLSPCGSTHVLNCKDGPIASSPSTAAHSCSSYSDSKESKSKTNNKQVMETRLHRNSRIGHIKSFRSRLAQPETELRTDYVTAFCVLQCRKRLWREWEKACIWGEEGHRPKHILAYNCTSQVLQGMIDANVVNISNDVGLLIVWNLLFCGFGISIKEASIFLMAVLHNKAS